MPTEHRYARIAARPVRPAPRPSAWSHRPAEIVAACLAARGLSERRPYCKASLSATGAACIILRDCGYSWPEIAAVFGYRNAAGLAYAYRLAAVGLWGEDSPRA